MGVFASMNRGQTERATLDAMSKSQAIIEFDLDGHVLTANSNFLATMGYELSEIVGKHHRMFVESSYAVTPEYEAFWVNLRSGEFDTGEYKRIRKDGKPVWIEASYNPVLDGSGRPVKVVKIASDVTARKLKDAEHKGQIAAISKSQAVIEFNLDGTVITANPRFCATFGYELAEIKGRHHSIFVPRDISSTKQYRDFWAMLSRGEFQAAEYKRVGKGGKEIWIQANYNPIFDTEGKVYKIVKYATDITPRKAAVSIVGSALAHLANGDLTVRIDTELAGEFEELRHAFNDTVNKFTDIVGKLRAASASLKTATGEILSGANDLSDRTTKQATAIEQTSTTLEQLATTVRENARRTDIAREQSRSVSGAADETAAIMLKANDAMEHISISSSKISDIIGLIDDIAFQTNLLALNASVEAARAGEAGAGFAVVAVEVRRLAQSAARASSQVKALIEQSTSEVAAGLKLVGYAALKLKSMVETVRHNATLIADVAEATQSQARSIGEVSTVMTRMEEMTQQNAALVQQINANIGQTTVQAHELDEIVDVFEVDTTKRLPSGIARYRNGEAATVIQLQARVKE